jgi:hypothetical protein
MEFERLNAVTDRARSARDVPRKNLDLHTINTAVESSLPCHPANYSTGRLIVDRTQWFGGNNLSKTL